MANRSFWKGYLKLSLVTCPVAMQPATTESERIRFHTLNKETGNRIRSRYVDAETGEPVEEEAEVKGYENAPDQYVELEDDELDAVALDSTRTIDIDTFVDRAEIGWVWYDKPHYLTPDDPVGEEAFAVIREAMRATRKVAISRLVLYRRERAVLLEPRGPGLVLWTLRFGDELRDAGPYFETVADKAPDKSSLDLIGKLIAQETQDWSLDLLGDPVQERLVDLITAKRKGRKPAKPRVPKPAEPPGDIVSIMDALKRSIAAETAGKRSHR